MNNSFKYEKQNNKTYFIFNEISMLFLELSPC